MPDNGQVCCILGVCCSPGSDAQVQALAAALAAGLGGPPSAYVAPARWLLQHFDLAPAGSLAQFKDALATHARKAASRGPGG